MLLLVPDRCRVDTYGVKARLQSLLDLTAEPSKPNPRSVSLVVGEADWFKSPEEVALHGWPAASNVRVVAVVVRGDRAEVVTDTDPSYQYWTYSIQRNGRWHMTVAGNGPCIGWDDPQKIKWDALFLDRQV